MVIGDFQMDQYHLMLKDHIRSQKEGMTGTKHFYWVPLYGIRSFHVSFHEMVTKASNGISENIYFDAVL